MHKGNLRLLGSALPLPAPAVRGDVWRPGWRSCRHRAQVDHGVEQVESRFLECLHGGSEHYPSPRAPSREPPPAPPRTPPCTPTRTPSRTPRCTPMRTPSDTPPHSLGTTSRAPPRLPPRIATDAAVNAAACAAGGSKPDRAQRPMFTIWWWSRAAASAVNPARSSHAGV